MPGQMTVPTIWVAPVRSHCMPMTISWLAAGDAPPKTPLEATRRASRRITKRCMSVLLSSRSSVREWPDAEVVPDIPPQAIQPLGRDREEDDDEGAEHHEAEVGNEVEHGLRCEKEAAKGLHAEADDDGQERDEDRPQHRAQDRPEPADDDHGEVVDGHVDLELLVVGDPEEIGVEDAGDARVEGRDREGEELVAEDVDADDLGRDVLVADGDEGA